MIVQQEYIFALDNFEGPLEFLLHLIQKNEIDIYDVRIQNLTEQFLQKLQEWQERRVEIGAEFVSTAAYLVWLKSKTLLPKQEQPVAEEEEDFHFEIIHHLLEYCQFKQTAKALSLRQEQQTSCFFRGLPIANELRKTMGIDHISLDELASLFQDVIKRAPLPKPQIHEENWRVSDKIHLIRSLLQEGPSIKMNILFGLDKSRLELIVTFLAILELMKIGDIEVGREQTSQNIVILAKRSISHV